MKKIAIVTATRAEFGLLLPVIQKLRAFEDNNLKVELIVTGTHLSEKFGYTVDEIKKFDLRIDHLIEIPVDTNSFMDISKNQSQALLKFTELFADKKYNAIVILGDRYEMLSVAIAAGNTLTPIFHLCGGDTTEGAMDEWIRHSITKISYMHFVTNTESYNRVIQLGEAPERVFNYGSTSVDNTLSMATMTKGDALSSIGLDMCDYALCTYHPVTLNDDDLDVQINSFLSAIKSFDGLKFIVTKSNADHGGERINFLLDEAAKSIKNLHVYSSLGVKRYLSLMKYAEFVFGNSSSGIIEAPIFKKPVVNIGDRQKGRLQSKCILNCNADLDSIVETIKIAQSDSFKLVCKNDVSPYGDGAAAIKIANKIVSTVMDCNINLQKKFFDLQPKNL